MCVKVDLLPDCHFEPFGSAQGRLHEVHVVEDSSLLPALRERCFSRLRGHSHFGMAKARQGGISMTPFVNS